MAVLTHYITKSRKSSVYEIQDTFQRSKLSLYSLKGEKMEVLTTPDSKITDQNSRLDVFHSASWIIFIQKFNCLSSDILRRPQKFEKISHFVFILFLHLSIFFKKVGDFFKFCGLVTVSELYRNNFLYKVSKLMTICFHFLVN